MADNIVNDWIPYGSDDPSVLVADPLTSRLTASSFPNWTSVLVGLSTGYVALGSATEAQFPTHDSVLGMKMTASDGSGGATGYRLTDALAAMRVADKVGQLSLEVESSYLEALDAIYAPDAWTPAGTEVAALSCTTTTGGDYQAITKLNNGTTFLRGVNNASAQLDYANNIPTGTNPGTSRILNIGKPRFVTVNIGWNNGFVIAAVDGVIVGYAIETTNILDRFDRVFLGSDRGQAAEHMDEHWMRNFQISSKFPVFSVNKVRGHIGVLSDSMFDDTQFAAVAGGADVNVRRKIDKSFQKKGMRTNFTVSENGGYSVDSAQTLTLHDIFPTMIKPDMTDFILQGGANDAGNSVSAATFETQYKDLVEKIMGENGNASTSVERLICCTTPSRYASGEANQTIEDFIISYQPIIKGLPAWWDAAYPLRAGALKVCDMYTALGGTDNVLPEVFKGQIAGSGDTIHYAPKGNNIYGDELVKIIWSF